MNQIISSPSCQVIRDKNCVRRIRFSASTILETTAENEDSIIVYARIKPSFNTEDTFLDFKGNNICYYNEIDKRGRNKTLSFSFHRIFYPEISQEDIFKRTVDKDVDSFIKGDNRLLFAYGTTGSGKTFTMLGTSKEPGILPRCTVKLFLTLIEKIQDIHLCPDQGCDLRKLTADEFILNTKYRDIICSLVEESVLKDYEDLNGFNFGVEDIRSVLDKLCDEVEETNLGLDDSVYSIWISYLEVYNENIFDLLNISRERKPLKMGLDSEKNSYVKGLNHVPVSSWVQTWKVFLYGKSRLHMNETQLNKNSSRSHSVFTIKIVKQTKDKTSVNSLSICDLAGSERQKKAQNIGDTLKESRNINTSLMVLNRCFSIVRENKIHKLKKISPYRESKLTQIFQKAFCYCEQITMFVNISRSQVLSEETKNVLKMSAVAQEMVKTMPPRKFLKPNSRFSIMCANPDAPFTSGKALSGCSGVDFLCSTASTHHPSDETINLYESKIKSLEDELKKLKEEVKSLEETLEDGREEFLNIEKKCKELEDCLDEKEILNELLEGNLYDLQEIADVRNNNIERLESLIEDEKQKFMSLHEEHLALIDELNRIENDKNITDQEMENLKKEKCKSDLEIENLKKENADLKRAYKALEDELNKKEKTKKGRPLLHALDLLVDSDNDNTEEIKENLDSVICLRTPRTPRSTRKTKKY